MSNEVYANGNEVSCKAAAGKSIAAFPDVCFTPPQTPATPPGVPIPYPNTGMASDTSSGSKTVQISGQEVMLKDSSFFKTSTGDEAGCAPKKNVITSVIQGKCYYTAWSMDVKFEGENAVRHLDMMTHNHASGPGATPPWPYMDAMAAADDPCKKEKKAMQKACAPESTWKNNCPPKPTVPHEATGGRAPAPSSPDYAAYQQLRNEFIIAQQEYRKKIDENPCLRRRRCMLVAKKDDKTKCCDGQTGHHVIDGASFTGLPGWKNYNYQNAPTVCCEGHNQHTGSHGEIHLRTGVQCQDLATTPPGSSTPMWTMGQAKAAGAKSVRKTFPGSGCSQKCLEAQLENGHKGSEDPPGSDSPIVASAQNEMSPDPTYQAQARLDVQ